MRVEQRARSDLYGKPEILFSCATLLQMLPSSTFLTSCLPVQIPLRNTHSPFVHIIYEDDLYQGPM